jgi:dipeptidyl aminopeptidase/acylaminoacyl peptidase
MKSITRAAAAVLLILATCTSAAAQVTPADYERAMGLRERWVHLTENVADPVTWVGSTTRFYYRKSVKGGFQFVMVDAASGLRRAPFDHDKLASALSAATGEKYTALLLPFETFILTNNEQTVDVNVAQAGWTCRLADYTCARRQPGAGGGRGGGRGGQPRSFGTTRDTAVAPDNRPKRSPDGKWEALVSNYNVVVRPAAGGALTAPVQALSNDGAPGDAYDPESIVWSPDSLKIAAYRVRPGFRRIVHRVESAPEDQLQPKLHEQLYVKPGDPIDLDQPRVFHVAPVRQLAVANELFPNPYTMGRLTWRRDSRTVAFEYTQRGHQAIRVIEVDAATGKARAAISEEPKTFYNSWRKFSHDVRGEGHEIIWMSERDGWNHLYLYDGTTGQVKTQITRGAWVVRGVTRVDEEKRQIWFSASGMYPGKDPYFVHYYRIDFDGSNLTPLTEADAHHDVSFSSDMAYYVDTYSRVDLPNISELRRTSDRSLVTTLEKGDIAALLAAGWKPPEVFVAKGRDGKTDIWGVIVRPTNFDPKKKYPVIENIYAGPHSSFVPKSFYPFGPHSSGDKVIGMQQLAEMGFIVVQIDGMGTANRSKAFHDVAWMNVGDAGFPDRILWHKAAAAKYPSYDITRVGIYGGSAGGQNSVGGLLFHPDFYTVAVSYNGCHDNRMDKIGWNEQWMGWPLDERYGKSSNVDNAHKLQGQVLLVVGELDMNVDPASTMQVVNALIKANKTFDLLVVPGGEHGAGRTNGPVEYAQRRQYDFFVRHLQGVATPDWNRLLKPTATSSAQ